MVTPVGVVATLILSVNVRTTQKVTRAIAAYHSTMTSPGGTDRPVMPSPARCVTATDTQAPVTTMPPWTRSLTATIRVEEEYVTIARETLVSSATHYTAYCMEQQSCFSGYVYML